MEKWLVTFLIPCQGMNWKCQSSAEAAHLAAFQAMNLESKRHVSGFCFKEWLILTLWFEHILNVFLLKSQALGIEVRD